MRLCRYSLDSTAHIGLFCDETIVPIFEIARSVGATEIAFRARASHDQRIPAPEDGSSGSHLHDANAEPAQLQGAAPEPVNRHSPRTISLSL
jgi:hypothetical protein